MNWEALVRLATIILIGYLPYKTLARIRKGGLSTISPRLAALLTTWFIVLSVVLVRQVPNLASYTNPWSVILFIITAAAWFVSPWVIRAIGEYPNKLIDSKPTWFVVRFEPHTLYLKFFEVLFQQAKFLFFLTVVFATLSFGDKILWFTLIIGFLHFNNLLFLPKQEAWIFTVLSFPMAVLFGFLIEHGLIFVTTSIHLWFYLLFAGFRWFRR